MNSERWKKIDELMDTLLELEPDKRAAFLDRSCAGDESLRRELESLLRAHEHSDGLMNTLSVEAAAEVLDATGTEFIGNSISHYEILNALGAGGMGEVYLARDTKLGRQVALKLLPPYFTCDKQRVVRFRREACAASALNHPNILTVYEIGQQDELHFIATEFIEGETLRQRIRAGGLRTPEALEVACQITGAVAAAHLAGIVHRDIKPENIMMRPDGLVKVLDFGVAKLAQRANSFGTAAAQTNVSTQISNGAIIGTVTYMSPEQLRGLEVDTRTDIFSMGIVLYEMIAGSRPFTGETQTDVIVSILDKDPPPLETHPELDRVVRKALAKDREQRYQTAAELQADLKNLLRQIDPNLQHPLPCPSCTRENPGSFAFCEACGAALKKICPGCRQEIWSQSEFCGFCGYQFSECAVAPREKTLSPSSERRRATIVYSIVSGSAAILEQLEPEEAETMIGSMKNDVARVVSRHSGVLERCSGEELIALFGVPSSFEDDYLRAVHAALELRSLFQRLSAETGNRLEPLRTYTGISSGPVVARTMGDNKYSVSGDALQLASRLAAHADPDEILVSAETQRLIQPYFKVVAKGALSLNPKSEAVTVYRIEGQTGIHTRLEAAEAIGLTRYTGRDKELGVLQSILDRALAGDGQLVTVIGEAGAGKSRLLLEFRRILEQRSIPVIQARCQAHGIAIPYLPFIDLLKEIIGTRRGEAPDRDSVISNLEAIDPNLAGYIPVFLHLLSIESVDDSSVSDLKGDDLRLAIEEALSALLTLRVKSAPAIVLLEDWHWADEASEETLNRLARLVAPHPLVLVATHRLECSVDWSQLENHTQLYISPLDEVSSIEIVESILCTKQLPEGLGDLVYRRTGGNPFFIEEICKTLIEDGKLRVVDGVATLEGSLDDLNLPDTVQAVVRTRLDLLDSESQALLRHASVLGREFSLRVLEHLPVNQGTIQRCLDGLQKQGLIQQIRVVPDPAYRFKHIVTQEVAYDSLLQHRRKALHELAGSAIEKLYPERLEEHIELLTFHYSRAENWSKAVRFGEESAEKASRLSRFAEALDMLEKTEEWCSKLEAAERNKVLIEVLFAQERLCESLGMRDRQQSIIDRVLSLLEPLSGQSLLAEALVRQGELSTLLGRFDEAQSALSRALNIRKEMEDSIGERFVLRSIGFLYWQQGRYDDAVTCNKTALSIDLEHDDLVGYTKDLTNLASILRSGGNPADALEYVEEALKVNETIARPFLQAYALTVAANIHRDLAEPERAKEDYQRAFELTVRHRLPFHQIIIGSAMASLCWERGEVDEALRLSTEVIALTRRLGLKRELAQCLAVFSQRLLELERFEAALPCLSEAAEIFSRIEDKGEQVRTSTSIAYVYERCGSDPGAAIAAWDLVRAMHSGQGNLEGELEALEGMARVARKQQNDPSAALQYFARALEVAERIPNVAKQGELLNSMGIVEWARHNFSGALEHYQAALQIFLNVGDIIHAGLMLNSIGVTYDKLGQVEEAAAQLRRALGLHRRSGQRLLEAHALAALGDLSEKAADLDRAHEFYLASFEIRREIADRKGEGWMSHHLASVSLSLGDQEQALVRLNKAVEIAQETEDQQLADACDRLRSQLEGRECRAI